MSDSLYGSTPEAPRLPRPTLLEQIEGVFSAPTALFQRLNAAPSWIPATLVTLLSTLLVTAVWSVKLDMEGFLRPIMERNPKATADQIDQGITFMSKFGPWIFTIQALFFVSIFFLFIAFVFWLIGKGTAEGEKPSFTRALVVCAVPPLVMIPHSLITIVLSLVKGVGVQTPEKIPPTSLGYFLHAESPKVAAFLFSLDVFALASCLLCFIAARQTMKLKPVGAFLCALLPFVLGMLLRMSQAH